MHTSQQRFLFMLCLQGLDNDVKITVICPLAGLD
jgi:hypothetical protein